MRHTTQIELENLYDLVAVKLGVMDPEDVRNLIVVDALVDTGATGLCLPTPLIEQLGLTPIETRRARTATGIIDRVLKRGGHVPLPASLTASFIRKSNLRYWNEQGRCKLPICLRVRLSSLVTWFWNILTSVLT